MTLPFAILGGVSVAALDAAWLKLGLGLGVILVPVIAFRWGAREDAKFVRFTYDDTYVTLTFHRAGKIQRTERLPRADVIDVALDDAPSSAATVHGLVLGTRLGDIELSDTRSSITDTYERAMQRIHEELGVPIRA